MYPILGTLAITSSSPHRNRSRVDCFIYQWFHWSGSPTTLHRSLTTSYGSEGIGRPSNGSLSVREVSGFNIDALMMWRVLSHEFDLRLSEKLLWWHQIFIGVILEDWNLWKWKWENWLNGPCYTQRNSLNFASLPQKECYCMGLQVENVIRVDWKVVQRHCWQRL